MQFSLEQTKKERYQHQNKMRSLVFISGDRLVIVCKVFNIRRTPFHFTRNDTISRTCGYAIATEQQVIEQMDKYNTSRLTVKL
ncbi:hypothetical protein [Nostoc sp. MS1]|uniref:hypothetical protein n=1 Tax=Nostoc sp. MS1 TaxID=2764711 RepID=UPI001CC439E9|nr:hypothetical protein [Nostoc sp. MS1]